MSKNEQDYESMPPTHLFMVVRYSLKEKIQPYTKGVIAHHSSLLSNHAYRSPLKNILQLLINKEEWALHGGIQYSGGRGQAVSLQAFLGYILRSFSKGKEVCGGE